ncbi:thioredoxin family protein [Neisseria weaveri]|uniref:MPT46 n=2 Tax=Neisseria weaveri TaxID=28091 RepID=A0A448VJJ2_9NEIS|nr:thioredoxin family protein [Neisseria weaveri]VEJ49930.1 MPT46 [Neisseria weaveri]
MKKLIAAGLMLLAVGQVAAAEFKPFSRAEFDALQKAGKPVLVDVYADWCTVCRRQEKELKIILQEPQFKQVTALKLDFDAQKQELPAFKVNNRSTLILFNKGKEVRRVVGETDPQRLRQFMTLPR